ncbi:MAG: SDR family NAD(P)-dependent oxidoreductase [Planctomycetota bacterium]|nr:SDR family NAD(P)-dependent oxidoreductase [Planctomycetota bacterium]
MSYWTNKTVVVTGGSAGLGFAIAQQLVLNEANVVLVARGEQRLQAACDSIDPDGLQVTAIPADVCRDEDVQRVIELTLSKFGKLDALFNVAGKSDRGLASTTKLSRFQELWELNFLAAVRCTQVSLPHLIKARGHVVQIGSLASKIAPRFLGAYPASKFPLAAFSQQLRLEHAADGLHVLLVCPGPIARNDAETRYQDQTEKLPATARQPGAGAKIALLDPTLAAAKILRATEQREIELILPRRAKWLFAISQLWPAWGDRLLRGRSG